MMSEKTGQTGLEAEEIGKNEAGAGIESGEPWQGGLYVVGETNNDTEWDMR